MRCAGGTLYILYNSSIRPGYVAGQQCPGMCSIAGSSYRSAEGSGLPGAGLCLKGSETGWQSYRVLAEVVTGG